MYMFSRSNYPMRLSKMLYDQTGSEKSNMAAFKPKVPISVGFLVPKNKEVAVGISFLSCLGTEM